MMQIEQVLLAADRIEEYRYWMQHTDLKKCERAFLADVEMCARAFLEVLPLVREIRRTAGLYHDLCHIEGEAKDAAAVVVADAIRSLVNRLLPSTLPPEAGS